MREKEDGEEIPIRYAYIKISQCTVVSTNPAVALNLLFDLVVVIVDCGDDGGWFDHWSYPSLI